MIYFVQATSGPIKIGYSNNPYQRIEMLQTGNHCELFLLAIMEGDQDLETELHKKFLQYRIRRDWFRPSNTLLKFMKDKAIMFRGHQWGFSRTHPDKLEVWNYEEEADFDAVEICVSKLEGAYIHLIGENDRRWNLRQRFWKIEEILGINSLDLLLYIIAKGLGDIEKELDIYKSVFDPLIQVKIEQELSRLRK